MSKKTVYIFETNIRGQIFALRAIGVQIARLRYFFRRINAMMFINHRNDHHYSICFTFF